MVVDVRPQSPLSRWKAGGGRYRIRLRETHLRDHTAVLLGSGAVGAAKLDIALRGLAALPDTGDTPGLVPEGLSWEDLHDLVRDGRFYSDRALKRKWVSDKLARLEAVDLLRRERTPGGRSRLVVLRDDGSGEPFDDPEGQGDNSYVTFLASIVATGRMSTWGSSELAAYFAAMIAERYARADRLFAQAVGLERMPFGGGCWYRPLSWFADRDGLRPASHVRIDFAERTLRRGLQSLKSQGLLSTQRIATDPRTGEPFRARTRVLYHNGFDDVRLDRHRRPRRFLESALRTSQQSSAF